MTINRKSDTQEILNFLDDLEKAPFLSPNNRWWTKYLFRVDDIETTARILNSGKILSRLAAQNHGTQISDASCADIIGRTDTAFKSNVRLYFRPKTPFQYMTEGFRPVGDIRSGAHCPAPVVLILDAREILTRKSTQFSNGNLGKPSHKPQVGDGVEFLRSVPFKEVYHDRETTDADKGKILFHRHAEILVPSELDLSPLHRIICRSQAEYETLLSLLEPAPLQAWSKKTAVKANFHFRQWVFIEEVQLKPTGIVAMTFPPKTSAA